MSHPKLTDHETAEGAIVTTCMIVAACVLALTLGVFYEMRAFNLRSAEKTHDDVRNDEALERGDVAKERIADAAESLVEQQVIMTGVLMKGLGTTAGCITTASGTGGSGRIGIVEAANCKISAQDELNILESDCRRKFGAKAVWNGIGCSSNPASEPCGLDQSLGGTKCQ